MKTWLVSLLLTAVFCCASAAEPPALCRRLPAGTVGAVLVETGRILKSPLYQSLQQKFPEIGGMLNDVQDQRFPLDACVRMLFFSSEDKEGGVLAEVRDLPEETLLTHLKQLPLTVEPMKLNEQSCYRIISNESLPELRQTLVLTYLDANTLLAADQGTVTLLLGQKTLSEQEIATLFPDFSEENIVDFSYLCPAEKRNSLRESGASFDGFTRQLDSFRARMRFLPGSPEGLHVRSVAVCQNEQAVSNALLSINGALFMGVGILFAENSQLGQQLLQAIRLTADGRRFLAEATLPGTLLMQLLDYGVAQGRKMMLPPDESPFAVPNSTTSAQ